MTVGAIDLWAARRRLVDVLLPLLALAGKRARTPTFQVLAAVAGMLGGAALIGRVVFGATLMLGCLLVAVDGLLREAPEDRRFPASHEDVLERYRRAR